MDTIQLKLVITGLVTFHARFMAETVSYTILLYYNVAYCIVAGDPHYLFPHLEFHNFDICYLFVERKCFDRDRNVK